MTRFGLILILLCTLTGGLFYFWNNKEPQKQIEQCNLPAVKPVKPKAAQSDVDFGPYMADLQRRIKQAWFPPRGDGSRRVVCIFNVSSDGKVSKLRLTASSKLKQADDAALAAVRKASPFRPLPKGAPSNVDIQFTFDYNAFKKTADHAANAHKDTFYP